MNTGEYLWVSKYPWIARIEIPARVQGWARYHSYPTGAGTDIIPSVSTDAH